MNRTIIAVLSALSSALISYIASNKERKGRKVRGKNKGKLAKIFILQSHNISPGRELILLEKLILALTIMLHLLLQTDPSIGCQLIQS